LADQLQDQFENTVRDDAILEGVVLDELEITAKLEDEN